MTPNKCAPSNDDKSETGFVLISALWLMALIGLVIAVASTNFVYSSKLSQARLDRSKNYFNSLGVTTLIANQILQIRMGGTPATRVDFSTSFKCQYRGEIEVQFSVLDHDGLIDLNAASVRLIQLGFMAVGFPKTQAKFLSERVVDYRDRDNVTASGELENAFYSSIGSIYLPKNSRFLSLFELDQLPYEKEIDFLSLSQVFTTKSGLDGIDIARASSAFQAFISQGAQFRIASRKSRERFYSLDTTIYRGSAGPKSTAVFRTISFLDLSSSRAKTIKLLAPWKVPISDEMSMEPYSNVNVESSLKHTCSSVLLG